MQRKSWLDYYVEATWEGACLIWPGRYLVARKVYESFHKVVLCTKDYVCHSCDNSHCINLVHLSVHTHRWNVYDAIKKGRFTQGFKEGNNANPLGLGGFGFRNFWGTITYEDYLKGKRIKK